MGYPISHHLCDAPSPGAHPGTPLMCPAGVCHTLPALGRVDSIMLVEDGFSVTSVDASDKMLKYALKERWNRRKEEAFDNWGRHSALGRTLGHMPWSSVPAPGLPWGGEAPGPVF